MIQPARRGRALAFTLVFLAVSLLPAVSQAQARQGKVLAGFLEERSIYYANYNIADLQASGVAGHPSHFVYAFGNVTTNPTPSCVIADAGWQGVPGTDNGLHQSSTGPATSPAGDTLATDGVATYNTLQNLPGFTKTFDWRRVAISIYNPSTQTFWTYDDPTTVSLKMAYIQVRGPGGLGGAFAWALKDDDANGTLMKTMAAGLRR